VEAEGDELPRGVLLGDDGAWTIPVDRGYASTDDEEALALIIALNRHVEQGGWQPAPLTDALEQLASGRGLDGIGYTSADLDLLIAAQTDIDIPNIEAEWVGMPEFVQPSARPAFSTMLHFVTLEDARKFWAEILQRGEPKQQTWWPEHDGLQGCDTVAKLVADG
jgi:hypothetical protein